MTTSQMVTKLCMTISLMFTELCRVQEFWKKLIKERHNLDTKKGRTIILLPDTSS